jgi:two-component system chemotaxis sensor kinase CheA
MEVSQPKTRIQPLSPRGLLVLLVILGASFVGVVLIPGFKLASDLVSSATALKAVGDLQRYPSLVRVSMDALRDRLNNHAFVQETINELKAATGPLDIAFGNSHGASTGGRAEGSVLTGPRALALRDLWVQERGALEPVLAYHGVPYQDSESTGTILNESGQALDQDVIAANRTSRHVLPLVEKELSAMSDELQQNSAQVASRLRLVMLAGLAVAALLMLLVSLLLVARKRQEARLQEARQQTLDILRTVKDGLFLLDHELVIGAAYSAAMESMFRRRDIAGKKFEDLLKNLVSEKTLATALKYINVLWSERTNEKLVKSINPLGEVEVHLDQGNGQFNTHYLQFDFHRVRVGKRITHVLVAVSDVSARVELALELQKAQQQSQAQVDTLLGILHVDPLQLGSFLNDSNAAMKMINAVLREPAREQEAFRGKLDTLFRQAHAVKGEAAALGLSSIESRAHSFEEDLKSLRDKPDLSGNDFLPLVIKLDDLLTHLQSIGELVSRLSHLQAKPSEATHTATDVLPSEGRVAAVADAGLSTLLEQLAGRLARDHGKKVSLEFDGLNNVPPEYRRMVKDISIQAVRNAIVHGIEPPAARQASGKPPVGTVRLDFQATGDSGYRFRIEDDGRGLATERIKEAGIKRGLISVEQAAGMDPKSAYALLFKAGFSTVEEVTKDAGRGVGMNVIAQFMQQIGGRVGLATTEGKFTRLTVTLPASAAHLDQAVVS